MKKNEENYICVDSSVREKESVPTCNKEDLPPLRDKNSDYYFDFYDEDAEKTDKWIENKRRELLKNAPKEEERLLHALPNYLKLSAQRQHYVKIGKYQYFIDIYIENFRLAIEVDGGYHKTYEQTINDSIRDYALSKIGIKTLRITNEAINRNEIGEFVKSINLMLGFHISDDDELALSLVTNDIDESIKKLMLDGNNEESIRLMLELGKKKAELTKWYQQHILKKE